MAVKTVFDFQDYKRYLSHVIENRPKGGRGFRSEVAEAAGVQLAYLYQVLSREAHFNLEHGEKVSEFLGHLPEEKHYFLLLIQYARAGTEGLRSYFRDQMKEVITKRLVLKNRLKSERTLSTEDQAVYYSAWYYGAVRVAVSIPKYRTRDALAKRLKLSPAKVDRILAFLVSTGLVAKKGEEYSLTTQQMHLGNDAGMIAKHHANWRMRAIHSVDDAKAKDLHYSYVVAMSEDDIVHIKSMLVNAIEEIQKRVLPSKEEALYSLCVDFFEV